MANETRRRFNFRRNAKVDETNKPVITGAMDRNIKQVTRDLNDLIGQMNLSLYGTDRVSDIQGLDAQFNKVLSAEINAITKSDKQDITSFLSQMVSKDQKNNALAQLYNNQFLAMSGDDYTTMQTFIYDAYRNRLLEQSDLHEVASQLIELSENDSEYKLIKIKKTIKNKNDLKKNVNEDNNITNEENKNLENSIEKKKTEEIKNEKNTNTIINNKDNNKEGNNIIKEKKDVYLKDLIKNRKNSEKDYYDEYYNKFQVNNLEHIQGLYKEFLDHKFHFE